MTASPQQNTTYVFLFSLDGSTKTEKGQVTAVPRKAWLLLLQLKILFKGLRHFLRHLLEILQMLKGVF